MKHFFLLLIGVAMGWAVPLRAALTVESAGVEALNDSAFLLEAEALNADPEADREAVQATFGVQLFNANFVFSDAMEIEATMGLIQQSNGQPVELQPLASGGLVTVSETFVLGPRQRQVVYLPAPLQPAQMLNPAINHRVSASVRFRSPGGAWSAPVFYQGSWRKWVHFFNAEADDSSLNVKAFTGALTVTDRQILGSVPGQESFQATLGMTLHRYDIESVAQPAVEVPVVFQLRLLESATQVEVPLATSVLRVTRPMLARSAAAVPDPVTDAWTQTLSFAPAEGHSLDPTASYELEVSVTTEELDSTPVAAVPSARLSAAERYLKLSGQLSFGGVATVFTELGNDPSPPMIFTGGEYRTEVAVVQGTAVAAPGRRYGDGSLLAVSYDPIHGHLTVVGGTQNLTTDETDIVLLGGLRVVRGVIRMDFSGALLETGGLILPAGFGVATSQRSRRHQPSLNFEQEPLSSMLELTFTSKIFTPSVGAFYYAFCDRLPLRFRTAAITWEVAAGTLVFNQTASGDPADPAGPVLTRSFEENELATLAPLLADPSAAARPSNDGFLSHITDQSAITIGLGAQGQAVLSVSLDLGPGQMETHFPKGVVVSWDGGRFRVAENQVVNPSYLESSTTLQVGYPRDCAGNCGSNAGPGQFEFAPTGQRYRMTGDGGLRAEGSVTPERLRWGTTELVGGASPLEGGLPFAHQTSQWTEGVFHAPGGWLAGGEAAAVDETQRAQSLLLSGVLADGRYERPLESGYRAGLADYAGLNLRVGTPGAKTGRSVLAGISTPDYELKGRSKYYVRAGGVSGIHEAVALIPSNLFMYGFEVTLDGFRLAFLDGLNVESKTGGGVHIDSPVAPLPGFDLDFKELSFKCRGQPGKMQLATQGETKSLAYWGTDILPLSLEFAQPVTGAGCFGVEDGFLLVGVQTRFPSVTPQKLHAVLGFLANGNLVTPANPIAAGLEVSSRFTLPPNLQVVGAGGVPWEVTVTGQAYLNNPLPSAPAVPGYQQPEQGFLTFPGTMNVPWFEDMKVQFHVSASSAANASSLIHLMGGWPANPAEGQGSGWQSGGQSYFTNKQFDADHLAFPAGMSVQDYRDPASDAFNPRAQKRWLGVVDFDFPLVWEGTQRRFESNKQTADLVVLGQVDRQVQALTPSTAEITFGVQLDIPRVNTQSVVAAVREGLSGAVADALTEALGGTLKNQLGQGLQQLDGLLSERLNAALEAPVNAAADPLVDLVLAGQTATSQLALLQNNLASLPALGLLDELDARLASGVGAIDATLAILGSEGDHSHLNRLVHELLERTEVPGAATLGTEIVDAALAEVLPEIEPDLEQARDVLRRVRNTLQQARSGLINQVQRVVQETLGSIQASAMLATTDIDAAIGLPTWELLNPTAQRAHIRRLISERLLACTLVPRFQYLVRQFVQDANESFRAALDDVLGQVNHLVREVIETAVDEATHGLTESRSPAAGEMGPRTAENPQDQGKLAGLNIEGYAQINDESLRVLDINGRFEFNVPDALRVQAHLRIEEYDANTPAAGCRPAGVAAAVVQIDARAECEWIGASGTIVEVGAKFSLENGLPIGFDGYFGLQGEIMLGPVVVNEARFMAGFGGYTGGAHWAYLGAKIRGRFNAYEASVGLFFGRTCDVAVIRMIDPEVGQALDKSGFGAAPGPITGVYFYGEAWIPINEVYGIPSTCLFTVRAGAGAGFFAFVKDGGQAFIGCKQMFGVEGRLLCIFSIRGEMRILGALATAGDPPSTGAAPGDGLYQRADDPVPPPGSAFVLYGAGEFAAELGICPFCLELSKSVALTWTIGGPNAGLDIEL